MRILIAEDDETSLKMLTLVLGKRGYEVVTATDGAEACAALLGADAPRLAILDWMMPEMSGPDVVKETRSHVTDQPPYIIMLTTKSETSDIVTALNAGANDYVTKPFEPMELLARVAVGQRLVETQAMLAARVEELREALEHIKVLRGIVPICASCKRIRDDRGYWNQVEIYIRDRTDVTFSHGVCPECVKRLYPDFDGPEGGDETVES